jgi:hypothetical protein
VEALETYHPQPNLDQLHNIQARLKAYWGSKEYLRYAAPQYLEYIPTTQEIEQ